MPHQILTAHPKKISFIFGALSVLALPPYYCLPLLFITISGLFYLINKSDSPKQAFSRGYWFGFGFFGLGFSWIGNALLVEGGIVSWLYPLVPLVSGAFFGLFIGFPALLTHIIKGFWGRFISFPAFWVLFEWIRSFIFTGFPWNLLGSTLSFSPLLIQTVALGGTYLLSLLVLYLSLSPQIYLHRRNKIHLIGSMFFFGLLSGFILTYGYIRLQSYQPSSLSDYQIRIVQPSISQDQKWNRQTLEQNFQQYIDMSRLPSASPLSLTVWGETASPFPLDLEPSRQQQITSATPNGGYLAVGSISYRLNPDGSYNPLNTMFLFDSQGHIQAQYSKSHLVPFGEYIPFRRWLPSAVRPFTKVIADFATGHGPETFHLNNLPSFGVAICYEIIFPHQIIDKTEPPSVLLNLTNDGWYGKSSGPYQHFEATRLRAVEEGITIIRAANSGISGIFSPTGILSGEIGLHQQGISDTYLSHPLSIPTFYKIYGNKIPLFIILILAICGITASIYSTKEAKSF